MEKLEMREFLADLETRIDRALRKWKKNSRVENNEVAQIEWQFEQAHIILDVFWRDGNERINIECRNPLTIWKHQWEGLTGKTADNAMDRLGNFAQIVQIQSRDNE